MAPTILLRERGASRGSGGGAGAGGGGSHAERHALSMEGVRVPPGGAGVRRMSEPSSGAAPGEARRSQNGSNGGGGERVPVLPLAVHGNSPREKVPFDAPTRVYSTRSLRAAMALTVPSCAIGAPLPSEMSAPMRRCRRRWKGTVPSAAQCCRPCQHGRALGPAARGRQRPAAFAPVLRRRCNHLMHRRVDRCTRWAMHHTARRPAHQSCNRARNQRAGAPAKRSVRRPKCGTSAATPPVARTSPARAALPGQGERPGADGARNPRATSAGSRSSTAGRSTTCRGGARMPQLGQEESDMAPSSTLKFCKASGAISLISLGRKTPSSTISLISLGEED